MKTYSLLPDRRILPRAPLDEVAKILELLGDFPVRFLSHYTILAAPSTNGVSGDRPFHRVNLKLRDPSLGVIPVALQSEIVLKRRAAMLERGHTATIAFHPSPYEPGKSKPFHIDVYVDWWGACHVGTDFPETPKSATLQQVAAWALDGEEGVSAMTIASVLFPTFVETDGYRLPTDLGGFVRCERFLVRVPEARARLNEVAQKLPEWGPVVARWNELVLAAERALTTRDVADKRVANLILNECILEGRALIGAEA